MTSIPRFPSAALRLRTAGLLAVAALSVGATWLAAKQGLLPGAAASEVAGADPRVTRENLNLMAGLPETEGLL